MIACIRGCTVRRRHAADCDDPDSCRGCELRSASNGMLCKPCHERLGLMLHDSPTVDRWLTVNLGLLSSVAAKEDYERTNMGGDGSPAPISVSLYDVRQQLRDQLASWVDEFLDEQRDLTGPKRHDTEADAGYLERMIVRVESMSWVGDFWEELGQTMTDAHALAPWRPGMRRRSGIPCPECGMTTLVVYGGEEHTTCQDCHTMLTPNEYGMWLRRLRYEADQREDGAA